MSHSRYERRPKNRRPDPGPDRVCPHCRYGYTYRGYMDTRHLAHTDGYLEVYHYDCLGCGEVMEAKGSLSFEGYLSWVRADPESALIHVEDFQELREMGEAERRLLR